MRRWPGWQIVSDNAGKPSVDQPPSHRSWNLGTRRKIGNRSIMDLFAQAEEANRDRALPLAARLRPRTLSEMVGQKHILGEGKLLPTGRCRTHPVHPILRASRDWQDDAGQTPRLGDQSGISANQCSDKWHQGTPRSFGLGPRRGICQRCSAYPFYRRNTQVQSLAARRLTTRCRVRNDCIGGGYDQQPVLLCKRCTPESISDLRT